MSVVDEQGAPGESPRSKPADLKPVAAVIPVDDADRSKTIHAGLGSRLDADFSLDNGIRSGSSRQIASPPRAADADSAARTAAHDRR